MCGIVAAASSRNIVPLLLEGLRRLEYRGYDSSALPLSGLTASVAADRRNVWLSSQRKLRKPVSTPLQVSRIRAGRRTALRP